MIAIDLGGTIIKAAVIGYLDSPSLMNFTTIRTPKTRNELLKALVELIYKLEEKPDKIALSCPGPADYFRGFLLATPNLPLAFFNLKSFLEKHTSAIVVMENDAVCFTLGEANYGAAKGKQLVLGITLGTGFGGGIVYKGKPFKGLGNAGHFSKMVLRNEPARDHFFKYKTYEVLLSERGLLARCPRFSSGLEMKKAAEQGDIEAIEAFSSYGKDLGLAVGSLIAAFDPDCVVIGGGLTKNWDLFAEVMFNVIREVTEFKAEVLHSKFEEPQLFGAASLLRNI